MAVVKVECDVNSHSKCRPVDRLPHHPHSNQAPSEAEVRERKSTTVINVEIERLESTLNSLKQKRIEIQKLLAIGTLFSAADVLSFMSTRSAYSFYSNMPRLEIMSASLSAIVHYYGTY